MKYFYQGQIQLLRLTLEKTSHEPAKNTDIIWEKKLYIFSLRFFLLDFSMMEQQYQYWRKVSSTKRNYYLKERQNPWSVSYNCQSLQPSDKMSKKKMSDLF